MFVKGLPKNIQSNLALLGKSGVTKWFYLAGGTATALWLGHRISVDLDFFTQKSFDSKKLQAKLKKLGNLEVENISEGTFNSVFEGTTLSFFIYPYPLLEECEKIWEVQIAGLTDIACMKIDAISSRGTKRDFVDLYFICQKHDSLVNLLAAFDKKYRGSGCSRIHVLKSLTYFADAEEQAMPRMLIPVKWKDIKQFFEKEVEKIGMRFLKGE